MPDFRPFPALRYTAAELDDVIAPPYDVIDGDQRRRLAERSPHNAVRLILPESDTGDRYLHAADLLAAWTRDGILGHDPAPAFYSVRMSYTDDDGRPRHTVGVLGGLVLPAAAGEGDVLPHERTLPKAKSDRLALLRATRVNLDPIWGLTPTTGLAAITDRAAPLAKTVDEDGVAHELGAITDPNDIAAVRAIIDAGPVVLADGHHRFETAINYREEQRSAGSGSPGDEAVMCLMVELAEDELWVQPIHRVLRGTGSATHLRLDLARRFEIREAAANTPEVVTALMSVLRTKGGVGLVDGEGVARLVPDDEAMVEARAEIEPVLADVPSAWFEVLARPLLDAAEVTYRHDAVAIAAMVGDGRADAAILLPPVTVEQIRAAANARVRMPQKTTFFAPKPRTGLVFRSLDTD